MTDHNKKTNAESIPYEARPADWFPDAEREAADTLGLTLYELMLRAGEAAFQLAVRCYPQARRWLVICGHGNNGGDGYVAARLAQGQGIDVTLLATESDKPLPDEAEAARVAWLNAGGVIHAADAPWPEERDLIIDGLLGTGLRNAPRAELQLLIEKINLYPAPVLALDIPSGLLAASGAAPGAVVQAQHTLAFIALKCGLLTGKARDVVGHLHCHDLGLSAWLAAKPAPFVRLDASCLARWLTPRRPTAHKGDHGRLLLIGGDTGTAGAIRMAGEAALRAGAGLVRVLTRSENIAPLLTARPELMVQELTPAALGASLDWADVVAVGPGLGTQSWGKKALQKVENFRKPMLWDADALNLLAINPDTRQNRVITPHPGEAARLLNCSVAEVERDRIQAARNLAKRYGGCVVLKGAGSVIASSQGDCALIDAGNPGMASGGMGDVLSGIIGALLAQKLPLYDATCAGAVAHGAAADSLARRFGTRGMLASDVIAALYSCVNPDINQRDDDDASCFAQR